MRTENSNTQIDNRGNECKNGQVQGNPQHKNKNFCFKDYKNNTIKSLNEVECFLNNLDKASKYIHLYKFLR